MKSQKQHAKQLAKQTPETRTASEELLPRTLVKGCVTVSNTSELRPVNAVSQVDLVPWPATSSLQGTKKSPVSNTIHIVGVDPGLIAGVAALSIVLPLTGSLITTMSTAEMPWRDAVTYVDKWTTAAKDVRIGSERYTIPTGRSVVTAQLDAIMCNGALDWLSSQREVTFVLQPRAEVKKLVTDAVLRKLGWYKKTKDGHANDAARHAGFMLFSSRPDLWLQLVG
jgi:hypothetical protein